MQARRDGLRKAQIHVGQQLERLTTAYLDHVIPLDEYRRRRYELEQRHQSFDAQLRHQAREDILTLHREKQRPTVYVTHDQSEAMSMGDRIAVMRDGQIEQLATGGELYERPRNQFVAFFIGTPSINLFDVDLQGDGDTIRALGTGFALRLPPEMREKVCPYIGKRVQLGVRPEDLHVPKMAPFPVSDDNTLMGLVNVIEPMSTGSSVYLSTLEEEPKDFTATFKVRLPATYLGKEIPLAINTNRVHLFDAETERSLIHG